MSIVSERSVKDVSGDVFVKSLSVEGTSFDAAAVGKRSVKAATGVVFLDGNSAAATQLKNLLSSGDASSVFGSSLGTAAVGKRSVKASTSVVFLDSNSEAATQFKNSLSAEDAAQVFGKRSVDEATDFFLRQTTSHCDPLQGCLPDVGKHSADAASDDAFVVDDVHPSNNKQLRDVVDPGANALGKRTTKFSTYGTLGNFDEPEYSDLGVNGAQPGLLQARDSASTEEYGVSEIEAYLEANPGPQ